MEEKASVKHHVNFKNVFTKTLTISALLFSASHATAAYIDASLGDAVVGNASAVYYNPAALTILGSKELVVYDSLSLVYFKFSGTARQRLTGYSQTGTATTYTDYMLPSAYLALPLNKRVTLGFGETYTYYGIAEYPNDSILRYFGTISYFNALDLMPSVGIRVTNWFSIGAGLDVELANLALYAMSGFPTLNIPDREGSSLGTGVGIGGHMGILLMPRLGTLIGLTYHSPVAVTIRGQSTFASDPSVISNQFQTTVTAPPSAVFSIDQFFTRKLGLIGTVQFTGWDTIGRINLQNVAFNSFITGDTILPSVVNNFLLHNTWRFALGAHYAPTDRWTLRASFNYDQSPENSTVQVAAGNYFIFGGGFGYRFTKKLNWDLNYGYILYQKQHVDINGASNIIVGDTRGNRNGVSTRLTWDF